MNFVLTWPWIQFSAGSAAVVIDQAWHCVLKTCTEGLKEEKNKREKRGCGARLAKLECLVETAVGGALPRTE